MEVVHVSGGCRWPKHAGCRGPKATAQTSSLQLHSNIKACQYSTTAPCVMIICHYPVANLHVFFYIKRTLPSTAVYIILYSV